MSHTGIQEHQNSIQGEQTMCVFSQLPPMLLCFKILPTTTITLSKKVDKNFVPKEMFLKGFLFDVRLLIRSV